MGNGQFQSEDERAAALDARDWIVRLSAGNVSAEELKRFHAWRDRSAAHQKAFVREREFWQLMEGVNPDAPAAAMVLAKAEMSRPYLSRRRLLVGGAIAATAAALAAPGVIAWMRADYSTGAGEQLTATLPDGTPMMLNTDTRVAIDFTANRRFVRLLGGEADFSITPGLAAPFQVAALGGVSQAAGGSLSVRALGDEAVVTAATAMASVAGAGHTVALSPGQQTRYHQGAAPDAPSIVDVDKALAWRSGRVVFDGAPFADAVRELGRYVPEQVIVTSHDRDDQAVSGTFAIRDAHAAIEALASTQGLRARRVPRVVLVIS